MQEFSVKLTMCLRTCIPNGFMRLYGIRWPYSIYSTVFRTGRERAGGSGVCACVEGERGAGRGARSAGRGARRRVRDVTYKVCKPIYIHNRVNMIRYVPLNARSLKARFITSLYMLIRRHAVGYTMDFCMSSAET